MYKCINNNKVYNECGRQLKIIETELEEILNDNLISAQEKIAKIEELRATEYKIRTLKLMCYGNGEYIIMLLNEDFTIIKDHIDTSLFKYEKIKMLG